MELRVLKSFATALIGASCLLLSDSIPGQVPPVDSSGRPKVDLGLHPGVIPTHVVVYVREANGEPISQLALVTVTRTANQYWQQLMAQGGQASFDNVAPGRYSVQVVPPGHEKAVENVDVIGSGEGEIVYLTLQPNPSSGEATSVLPRASHTRSQSPKGARESALSPPYRKAGGRA
jgi:hypothetical protein